MIPDSAKDIYPNPVQKVFGTPTVVFRDHRFTLPMLYRWGELGLIQLPVSIVTFDYHKDSLVNTDNLALFREFREKKHDFDDVLDFVSNHLSPRDDDWITSGMELGLISDAVQFGCAHERAVAEGCVTGYHASDDTIHRIFHLCRPDRELSYKGALSDPSHQAVKVGLWDVLHWDPSNPGFDQGEFVMDIDLDFFTFSWDMYTFPFTAEVYEGEFGRPSQSTFYENYTPKTFLNDLIKEAHLMNIACEPDFCGGREKCYTILGDVNRYLLDNALNLEYINVDYKTTYPSE